MDPDGFYLFQIPGTHHLLRPEVNFEDGYNKEISLPLNEFYYASLGEKGLVLFTGDEPHMNIDRYADGLFYAAKELNVRRMAVVGGVYGAMPYDRDREVSCTYSLPRMKKELEQYAVRFSNYNGGATIGSYIVDRAESHDLEMIVFNAFVPAYDFSQAVASVQGVRIEHDYKAWYELMRRFNYMFGLGDRVVGSGSPGRGVDDGRSTRRSSNWRRRCPRWMCVLTSDRWRTSSRKSPSCRWTMCGSVSSATCSTACDEDDD